MSMALSKRELMAKAREQGRREFERYPLDLLTSIRSNLLGFPPDNQHTIGRWVRYRPSAASEQEYPGIERVATATQLRDIDESRLYGANQILAAHGLAAKVVGKWLEGTLVIVKVEKRYENEGSESYGSYGSNDDEQ